VSNCADKRQSRFLGHEISNADVASNATHHNVTSRTKQRARAMQVPAIGVPAWHRSWIGTLVHHAGEAAALHHLDEVSPLSAAMAGQFRRSQELLAHAPRGTALRRAPMANARDGSRQVRAPS
jgi:hypothetical protein